MRDLTKRDVAEWNSKLSGLYFQRAGKVALGIWAVFFVTMLAMYLMRTPDFIGSCVKLSPPLIIGIILYLIGSAKLGFQKPEVVVNEAWIDINKKLFNGYECNPIKGKHFSSDFRLVFGNIEIQLYIRRWQDKYHSDGKQYERTLYSTFCVASGNSENLRDLGCTIELKHDVRERGAMRHDPFNSLVLGVLSLIPSNRNRNKAVPDETIMDNLEFERIFDVKTENDIKCKMYLTPNKMEQIVRAMDNVSFESFVITENGLTFESSQLSFLKRRGKYDVINMLPAKLDYNYLLVYRDQIFSIYNAIDAML